MDTDYHIETVKTTANYVASTSSSSSDELNSYSSILKEKQNSPIKLTTEHPPVLNTSPPFFILILSSCYLIFSQHMVKISEEETQYWNSINSVIIAIPICGK